MLYISLAKFTDTIIIVLFIILILLYLFGQSWRGLYANRRMKKALRKLRAWRNYGISVIKRELDRYFPPSLSDQDAESFIERLIEFQIIAPTTLDPPIFEKIRYLLVQKQKIYRQLMNEYVKEIPESKYYTVLSLIYAASELNEMYKEINHDIILGKKIHSAFYIQQASTKISQILLKAQAYRTSLDTLLKNEPIGDSIGPLTVKEFIRDVSNNPSEVFKNYKNLPYGIISYEVSYKERLCVLLRPFGPASNTGFPGLALEDVFQEYESKGMKISLVLTIDAQEKKEGDQSGKIIQGLGVSVGGEGQFYIDKFHIENLTIFHDPKIQVESIVCKQSFFEAMSPITNEILNSIPTIIHLIKRSIRSSTEKGDCVVIIGVGNALGVPN